ncbi:uncharacterized protein LOC106669783 isoform X2 [Cimex lectularius]|uniref:Uncharacterized protein n=1 Tax=Cimex lectularius TaxID=79782 RepID=A0A8I6S838_CIMLE|nr:uncharacterized protein LOC106669783 isoform X2 [Cimex lectularius]
MSLQLSSFHQPTVLEQLLEEINFQRMKEMRQLMKDESGFVMLQGSSYWTDLFIRHFLFQAEQSIDGDDMLFFVRKKHVKGTPRYLPKFETEVAVYRKESKKLPIGDPELDWEETVYLNLIIHQFEYILTLAICTRTSPKQLQILRRISQKVYASPSRRRMDTKGEVEEITYPQICFMVDNFNEVMSEMLVRDGELVCVELLASDRENKIQGVLFSGSIRYDALKRVYDARASLSSKMAQRMTFGLLSNSAQRVEFVTMKGPQGKGYAEMAVTKPRGCGAETPTSEPGYCAIDMWDEDWEDPEDMFLYRHQRRLSDPSANLSVFVRGGWQKKPNSESARARSENEGLDTMAQSTTHIQAGDLRDDTCMHPKERLEYLKKAWSKEIPVFKPKTKTVADGTVITYWCELREMRKAIQSELDDGAINPLWTMRGFTQTFHMWKENKRIQSVPLNSFLTYITLPWWSITKDILDMRVEPILTF